MKDLPALFIDVRMNEVDPAKLLKGITWTREWCGNPDQAKGEGCYFRCLEHIPSGRRCLQVIIFYQIQKFPYHPHDFAPIYFYFDQDGQPDRILYDFYHHQVAVHEWKNERDVRVVVYAPWHAFRINHNSLIQRPFQGSWKPLDDDLLRSWWIYPDMRQFKLRSKFTNPFDPHLFPENVPYQATFRDEAPCPRCGSVVHLDLMHPAGNGRLSLPIACQNGHQCNATYDLYKQTMVVELL